jgi:hypothetical protein
VLIGRLDRFESAPPIAAERSQTSARTLATPDSATLALLVGWSGAVDGFLYVVEDGRLALVAPPGCGSPPKGLMTVLERAMRRGLGWQEVFRCDQGTYRCLVVRAGPGLDERLIAVAALRAGEGPMHPPDLARLAELADALVPTTA